MDISLQDIDEIDKIKSFFRQNKVKVIKMNHTLKNQGGIQYEGFLQLTEDNQLKITNKKPNAKYLLSSTKKELEAEKERAHIERLQKFKEYSR